jgi:hypothetical protein
MRIVHESPDLLVVAELAVGIRTVGDVIAALGVVLLGLAIRTGGPPILPGAVTFAVGAMFIALPAITTFRFSRADQRGPTRRIIVGWRKHVPRHRAIGGRSRDPVHAVLHVELPVEARDGE